eukprot:3583217-Pleurochrysis_carterae.AAC.1
MSMKCAALDDDERQLTSSRCRTICKYSYCCCHFSPPRAAAVGLLACYSPGVFTPLPLHDGSCLHVLPYVFHGHFNVLYTYVINSCLVSVVLHARYGMGHRNDARAARGTAQGAGGATE